MRVHPDSSDQGDPHLAVRFPMRCLGHAVSLGHTPPHGRRDRDRRWLRGRDRSARGLAARPLGAAARGARPARRPHLDERLGRQRRRARRRVGALASAAHVVGDHAGGSRDRAQRRRRAGELVRRRRPAHRHDRRARRDRRRRLAPVRRGCRGVPAEPARPALRDRRAGAVRPAEHRRAGRPARPDGRAARRALGGARVARPRPARGCRGGFGAPLARTVGLQPGAHAVHGRPRDARRAAPVRSCRRSPRPLRSRFGCRRRSRSFARPQTGSRSRRGTARRIARTPP